MPLFQAINEQEMLPQIFAYTLFIIAFIKRTTSNNP